MCNLCQFKLIENFIVTLALIAAPREDTVIVLNKEKNKNVMNINNLAERPLLHSPHEPDSQPRYEDRGWMDYSVLNNTWKEKYQEQGKEGKL